MAGTKKTRGDAARAAVATVDILPPDPAKLSPDEAARRNGQIPATTRWANKPPSEGELAFREGMNPRAVRRRVMEHIRQLQPRALETLDALMNESVDDRVRFASSHALVQMVVGRPGEQVSGDDDTTSATRGTADPRLGTPEERDEMNAALATVARISAIWKARAANE
jgi:hypothetical protein